MSDDPVVTQLIAVADLLMGAAHAGGHFSWPERSAVARVLAGFVDTDDLPGAVRERVQRFDPTRLDVERAVSHLTIETSRDRTELLALVSRVVDADAELKPNEIVYLRRVAAAIGATDAELSDFLRPD